MPPVAPFASSLAECAKLKVDMIWSASAPLALERSSIIGGELIIGVGSSKDRILSH